jgi:hypothetical protein
MRSGQVKPVLADVVQANTHISALTGFGVMQLYRLEDWPSLNHSPLLKTGAPPFRPKNAIQPKWSVYAGQLPMTRDIGVTPSNCGTSPFSYR